MKICIIHKYFPTRSIISLTKELMPTIEGKEVDSAYERYAYIKSELCPKQFMRRFDHY